MDDIAHGCPRTLQNRIDYLSIYHLLTNATSRLQVTCLCLLHHHAAFNTIDHCVIDYCACSSQITGLSNLADRVLCAKCLHALNERYLLDLPRRRRLSRWTFDCWKLRRGACPSGS